MSLAKDDIAEIFWIGLNQLDVSGGWQWSDHKPLNFLNWHPGTDISGDIDNIHNNNQYYFFFHLIPFSEASFPPSQRIFLFSFYIYDLNSIFEVHFSKVATAFLAAEFLLLPTEWH